MLQHKQLLLHPFLNLQLASLVTFLVSQLHQLSILRLKLIGSQLKRAKDLIFGVHFPEGKLYETDNLRADLF